MAKSRKNAVLTVLNHYGRIMYSFEGEIKNKKKFNSLCKNIFKEFERKEMANHGRYKMSLKITPIENQ